MNPEVSGENDCENKQSCYCCFCGIPSMRERKLSTEPASKCSITSCLKIQKSTMFFLQAFVVWVVLCLPGNIVTLILYQKANTFVNQVRLVDIVYHM